MGTLIGIAVMLYYFLNNMEVFRVTGKRAKLLGLKIFLKRVKSSESEKRSKWNVFKVRKPEKAFIDAIGTDRCQFYSILTFFTAIFTSLASSSIPIRIFLGVCRFKKVITSSN